MPGHYGVEKVTTQNLTVVDVIADKGLILVKGSIPGHNESIVYLHPAVKLALRESHQKK